MNSISSQLSSKTAIARDPQREEKKLPQAPLFSRLFMIIREMPGFLSTAYSLRYKDITLEANLISRTKEKVKRYKQLVSEIFRMNINQEMFDRNVQRLNADFAKLNRELELTNRPICAYFVSSLDCNGAILGDHLYYYHNYKIDKFRKHFDVSAKVVRSTNEMFYHLNQLKVKYPNRPIKVVDIVAHGNQNCIDINHLSENGAVGAFQSKDVGNNDFQACASDADIIIDACSTGMGVNNIAKVIAEKNPGKRVHAPGVKLFFSKPIFKKIDNETFVSFVTHGFAIVKAYTSKIYQVANV